MLPDSPPAFKSGFVALVGRPNVGKSTLLNTLLGKKLSIVTPKAQTTRHRISGILSESDCQIIFLDTPGIIDARTGLDASMMRQVSGAVSSADLVVFLVDARSSLPDHESLQRMHNLPAILALNKVDLMSTEAVLPLAQAYRALREWEAIVPVSALDGYNVEALLKEIRSHLPAGPHLYPEDIISEHPERFFVAEIIREKVFRRFRAEVPYAVAVTIPGFTERPGRKDLIEADIFVERATQKAILIGAGGQALKQTGMEARKEIESFLGRPVYLKLFVRVRADWRNQRVHLRNFGY